MEDLQMIDFKRIKDIVPEGGSLTLKLDRTGEGELRLTYAPRYAPSAKQQVPPFTMTGSPEELGPELERLVAECFPFEKMLGEGDRIAKRKADLQKQTTGGKGKPKAKPVEDTGGLFSRKGGK